MLIFRWAILFLLLGAAVSFAFFIGTGDPRYKRWGLRTLKWMLVAGLVFFGVLILERIG